MGPIFHFGTNERWYKCDFTLENDQVPWELDKRLIIMSSQTVNNYDLAIQKDVAIYFQPNFMFYIFNPLPHHFKVEN